MLTVQQTWVHLSASPLLYLTLTIAAFVLAARLHRRARCTPLLNPVLISILLLATCLTLTGTDYETYVTGAQCVHF